MTGFRRGDVAIGPTISNLRKFSLFLSFHRAFCRFFNHTHQHTHIYYLRSLKFTLKHLKRSYMFRSHDHPQGAYIVPC